MRTRKQIEDEAKDLGRQRLMFRKETLVLEVLLDIRDGLYEDKSQDIEGISI